MIEQFARLSLDELTARLCQKRRTLIIFHARPDADAVGSAFALRELLRAMDIPAICACADEVPDRLRFITDGTQGSVLLEEGMELDHDRVISVDSASPSQLGALYDRLHKYIDVMIDHHATGTIYADSFIDSRAAATGEIIFEVAKRLLRAGRLSEIPHRAVRCLYAAISSDTGGFRYANVTPRTMRTAAELIELGAEHAEINHRLFEEKTVKQIRAEGEAARRLQTFDGDRIASVTFPYSSKFSMSLSDEHLETIIDIPRSVSGAEVAFSIRQPDDAPVFRVSMRSSSDFDVSAVCSLFGGGGHMRAAGCTVKAANVREAEEMILDAIKKRMNNRI